MNARTKNAIHSLDQAGGVWLSGLLILLALFLVWVAFFEKNTLVKAATAAWVMLP